MKKAMTPAAFAPSVAADRDASSVARPRDGAGDGDAVFAAEKGPTTASTRARVKAVALSAAALSRKAASYAPAPTKAARASTHWAWRWLAQSMEYSTSVGGLRERYRGSSSSHRTDTASTSASKSEAIVEANAEASDASDAAPSTSRNVTAPKAAFGTVGVDVVGRCDGSDVAVGGADGTGIVGGADVGAADGAVDGGRVGRGDVGATVGQPSTAFDRPARKNDRPARVRPPPAPASSRIANVAASTNETTADLAIWSAGLVEHVTTPRPKRSVGLSHAEPGVVDLGTTRQWTH